MTFIAISVMCILLALIPNLIWLIAWGLALFFGYHISYQPFGICAIGLVSIFIVVMLYGIYIGRFQLEINRQEFCAAEVPAELNGYRIVHISDMHLSTFDDRPDALRRVVDSINALEPDLICFTGDLVSLGMKEALPYQETLKKLKATDGICSVLGNHDFLIYRRDFKSIAERDMEIDKLASFERDTLGWNLLRNSNFKCRITVMGVDNTSCTNQGFKTIYAGNLDAAMNNTEGFRILLSHDPSHWRAEVAGKQNIPLTLSGHTHAGQVRLFGWPLSSLTFTDNEGWYHDGKQSLYINRGIGCTLPMRIGCPQEITLITLIHKE